MLEFHFLDEVGCFLIIDANSPDFHKTIAASKTKKSPAVANNSPKIIFSHPEDGSIWTENQL